MPPNATSQPYRVFWRAHLRTIADLIQQRYTDMRRRRSQPRYTPTGPAAEPAFWQDIARAIMDQGRDFGDVWEQAFAQCEPCPWPSSLLIQTRVDLSKSTRSADRSRSGAYYLWMFAHEGARAFRTGITPDLHEILAQCRSGPGPVLAWLIGHYFDDSRVVEAHETHAISDLMHNSLVFDAYWNTYPGLVGSCCSSLGMLKEARDSKTLVAQELSRQFLMEFMACNPETREPGPDRVERFKNCGGAELLAFLQRMLDQKRVRLNLAVEFESFLSRNSRAS